MSLVRFFLLHFDTLQVDCDDYSDAYVRHTVTVGGTRWMDGWTGDESVCSPVKAETPTGPLRSP